MDLTAQELTTIVTKALRAAFEAERKSFWVHPEQHYQDHEFLNNCRVHSEDMRKDHEFVKEIRESAALVRQTAWKTTIGIIVTAAIAFFVWALKIKLSS